MTEALDAMVKAMVAEIVAQECRLELQADGVTLDSGYDGACFDMEKAARAGLVAIRDIETPDWVAEGSAWAAPGRMIDEILKEKS